MKNTGLGRKLLWFALIWLLSVTALAVVAGILRWMLR